MIVLESYEVRFCLIDTQVEIIATGWMPKDDNA